MRVQPVILCGGSGTRLWPLSRASYPKQMLALDGVHSLLQATALRLDDSAVPAGWHLEAPLLVGREDYRFVTAEQLRQVGIASADIVLEPVGRNTAPALTAAALASAAVESAGDAVLVVMPADHVMLFPERFRAALAQAVPLAARGSMVTFGIVPTAAETGYGYIRRGHELAGSAAAEIAGFFEKPDLATAQRYVAAGDYLWNSGIFVVRASVWLTQIGRFRPDILAACRQAMAESVRDQNFLRLGQQAFAACPADSIDCAVMERLVAAGDVAGAVLPLDAGWSDVGAWGALWQIGKKDEEGNVLSGDVLALQTYNTLVRAESRLVACVGMEDAIVIETPDAVLVAHRDRLDEVRNVVARLKQQARPECDAHRKVFRPWGCYDSIDAGHRFQVKRIVVSPGARLSLQMHHHRAEHWIVVVGTARVTRGSEEFLLSENESTYIPLGTPHRLENPGKVPLEIIEVQSGAYLGEDDIVRFEDTYGRDCRSDDAKVVALKSAQAS